MYRVGLRGQGVRRGRISGVPGMPGALIGGVGLGGSGVPAYLISGFGLVVRERQGL